MLDTGALKLILILLSGGKRSSSYKQYMATTGKALYFTNCSIDQFSYPCIHI